MALADVHTQKRRKNELDDITNNNNIYGSKKQKSGAYFDDSRGPPKQLRLPSPCDNTSATPKARSKSVSFDLNSNRQYQNSPLLTPKDEDEFENSPLAPHEESGPVSSEEVLRKNPDYLGLSSTSRLLAATKDKTLESLTELSDLLSMHTSKSNKQELVEFIMRLTDDKSALPAPVKVIKAPLIDWTKYNSRLQYVSAAFERDTRTDDSLFKTLNVFSTNK